MFAVLVAAFACALLSDPASAQTKLRIGKAQAQTFAFVPVDVGIEAGIFKKHGLEIESSAFAGDARMLQALTANAIDIAVGGGPTLANIAKGVPMLGIAALANEPSTIMLVVLKDGPVKTIDDLKGRTVSVSTAGSLTYWLAQELSRSKGWGPDGFKIATLGTSAAQIAALKTQQIDGVITESSSVLTFEEEGGGRVLVKFGDRIKDFHVHVIFGHKDLLDHNPEAARAFLAAWFETVRYMREHKDETIAIAARVSEVSKGVATRNYEELMPIFSETGHFNPKALDVLARSFVEMGLFSSPPDMSKFYTEAFLPK